MPSFKQKIRESVLLLNGATGTNLLDKGLQPGESPSMLNIRSPEEVLSIQKAYVEAGSDILLTNTFSANPMAISPRVLRTAITEGACIAQRAAGKKTFVFGDVGPLGELIKPYGELSFDDARRIFRKLFTIFDACGIRAFFLETFTSIIEAKAAFLAARRFSDTVIVCMSLQDNGRTLMGEIPEAIAVTFDALGACAVGINCTHPDVALEAIQKMVRVTDLPLVVKPNAGHIEIKGATIHHTLCDAEVASYYVKYVKAGASVIGGCCGTTPEYIRRIAKKSKRVKVRARVKHQYIASQSKILSIETDRSYLVGERLNPSGRKKVKRSLLEGDYSVYREDALTQETSGADALDINAFIPGIDEKKTLEKAVFEVLKNSSLPLFVDTQDYSAAQRILSLYPGVGVYNSVPSRKRELLKWLPMIKEYGFKAVISLIGETIPRSAAQRMKNARLALSIGRKVGFPKENMLFDPLVFTIATDSLQISHTLATVAALHKQGLKTVLGISNVSFGLPGRSLLNATLAAAAVEHGTTFLIINPLDTAVMNAVRSAEALFRGDVTQYCSSARELTATDRVESVKKSSTYKDLVNAIIHGDAAASVAFVRALLDSGTSAQQVIDKHIANALKRVGDRYEEGTFFIPDLMRAAEASKSALTVIKKYLPVKKKRGKIMLATVKGDIHDIGKNIAAMMFESAGYEVIDLGKDVACSTIVKAIKKYRPDALGLSALLTTTMPEMERIIRVLEQESLNVKVIIGGPNVSEQYAKQIGAYAAATNVLQGIKIVKTFM